MKTALTKRKNNNTTVFPSSGNVFTDLGLPEPEEKQTKVRLAVEINHIIEAMGLPQVAAAERLRINQPKISALTNYRLSGFSVERLINFLNALGRDVEIVIRKTRSRRPGKTLVSAA
jgi:predicted XRE-type DNA-binding protein